MPKHHHKRSSSVGSTATPWEELFQVSVQEVDVKISVDPEAPKSLPEINNLRIAESSKALGSIKEIKNLFDTKMIKLSAKLDRDVTWTQFFSEEELFPLLVAYMKSTEKSHTKENIGFLISVHFMLFGSLDKKQKLADLDEKASSDEENYGLDLSEEELMVACKNIYERYVNSENGNTIAINIKDSQRYDLMADAAQERYTIAVYLAHLANAVCEVQRLLNLDDLRRFILTLPAKDGYKDTYKMTDKEIEAYRNNIERSILRECFIKFAKNSPDTMEEKRDNASIKSALKNTWNKFHAHYRSYKEKSCKDGKYSAWNADNLNAFDSSLREFKKTMEIFFQSFMKKTFTGAETIDLDDLLRDGDNEYYQEKISLVISHYQKLAELYANEIDSLDTHDLTERNKIMQQVENMMQDFRYSLPKKMFEKTPFDSAFEKWKKVKQEALNGDDQKISLVILNYNRLVEAHNREINSPDARKRMEIVQQAEREMQDLFDSLPVQSIKTAILEASSLGALNPDSKGSSHYTNKVDKSATVNPKFLKLKRSASGGTPRSSIRSNDATTPRSSFFNKPRVSAKGNPTKPSYDGPRRN